MQTDVVCYIYNVTAQKFLSEGSISEGTFDYGTHGALSKQGLKFKVTSSGDGIYNLNDSSVSKAAWKMLFVDGAGAAYTDGGGRGHQDWAITATTEDATLYQISINPADAQFGTALYPNCVLGWDGTTSNVVNPLLDIDNDASGTFGYKWGFVSLADYAAYGARLQLYETLNAAEAVSVSTDAALAVYNNADATAEEIMAAMSALKQAINSDVFSKGTVDNPADATSLIVNADFSDATGKGWSEGTFKDSECERYNTNFTVNQTLRGIKDGVYRVNVQGFYRDGDTDPAATNRTNETEALNAYVYAGNDSVNMQSIFTEAGKLETGATTTLGTVPNTMDEAAKWFAAGYYPTNEVYTFADADTLNIGIKKHTFVDSDWTIFDSFKIFYYGNSAAAYKLVLKPMIDGSNAYVKGETVCGEPDVTALSAVLTGANATYNKADATVDEVKASIVTMRNALGVCKKSADSYARLKKALEEGQTANDTYQYDALGDYLIAVGSAYDEKTVSGDSAMNIANRIYVLIDEAKANSLKEGDDCTGYIVNPTFEKNVVTGWTYTSADNKKPSISNGVAEFYGGRFDINQTLTKLPNGKYELSCQAFQRPYDDATSISKYQAGENDIRCYLYANASQTPVMNLVAGAQETKYASSDNWEVGNGTYYPHTRAASAAYFDQGCYQNKVTVVVTDNVMKIGVKYTDTSMSTVGSSWSLFDNFKLTYMGRSAEVLKDEIAKAVENATALQSSVMNADKKTQLGTAITAASSATDAIAALKTLYTAIDSANASVSAYKTLSDAILGADTTMAKTTASAATTATYNATMDAIKAKLNAGSYADTAIPAAIEEVKMALAIYLMGDVNGSDENPADVSNVIVNGNFDNGTSGWTGAGTVKASEMEFYDRTFNLSQTIKGLKNGTYKLTVTGFYRDGLAQPAADVRSAGTEALNAILYAGEKSVPMVSMFTHTDADTLMKFDVKVKLGEDSVYVNNTMDGARMRFDAGFYGDNSLFIDVTNNTLTFGIRKDVAVTKDWTIFDSFKLYYYGDHSTNGIKDNLTNGRTVTARSYFNASGMCSSKPVRGLNIVKTTYSDGTQQVSKVMMK